MKLFQQMLVAGATASLIAPIAAQASDVVNIEEMNSYARSQTKSSRIDSKTFINKVNDVANLENNSNGFEVSRSQFEAGSTSVVSHLKLQELSKSSKLSLVCLLRTRGWKPGAAAL